MLIDDGNYLEYSRNHSNGDVAKYFNFSLTRVKQLNRQYNVPFKSNKHCDPNFIYKISDIQNEILIGCMLGDGSCEKISGKKKNSSFLENHTSPQKEYCEYLNNILQPFTLGLKLYKSKKQRKIKDRLISSNEVYGFQTISHPYFTEMETKWYLRDENGRYILNKFGRRIKIVPADLVLTPRIIAFWFFGDGYNNAERRRAIFCTNGFEKKYVELLIEKLNNIGISGCTINGKNEIYVPPGSFLPLIEMIRLFVPTRDMKYKVDLSLYTAAKSNLGESVVTAKLNEQQVREIRINKFNKSYRELGLEYGISRSQIGNIMRRKAWKYLI